MPTTYELKPNESDMGRVLLALSHKPYKTVHSLAADLGLSRQRVYRAINELGDKVARDATPTWNGQARKRFDGIRLSAAFEAGRVA